MRRWGSRVSLLVVLVLTMGVPAASATHGPGCPALASDPDTRLGKIAAGNKYLRALVTHDASDVPLASDVVRVENGNNSGSDATSICNQLELRSSQFLAVITGIRQLKWYVDGDDAIAFYLLDTVTSPTYITERFKVVDGEINEIEAIFFIDVTGYAVGPESVGSNPDGVRERFAEADHGPLGPIAPANGLGDTTVPDDAARGRVRNAARAYLDALVSHDASRVPLADAAFRTENRRPRGDSGAEIREALEADAMSGITGVERPVFYVDGEQAVAMYLIKTAAGDVWAGTRFRVIDGLIHEIESNCAGSEFCGASA